MGHAGICRPGRNRFTRIAHEFNTVAVIDRRNDYVIQITSPSCERLGLHGKVGASPAAHPIGPAYGDENETDGVHRQPDPNNCALPRHRRCPHPARQASAAESMCLSLLPARTSDNAEAGPGQAITVQAHVNMLPEVRVAGMSDRSWRPTGLLLELRESVPAEEPKTLSARQVLRCGRR
jgi:hypothetical protein